MGRLTIYLVSSCWHQSKHSLFASWQTKAWFPYLVAQFFLTSYVQQCHTKTYNMAWSLKWLPNISMPFLITTGRNFVIPAIVTICNNCSSDTPNPESMNPGLFSQNLLFVLISQRNKTKMPILFFYQKKTTICNSGNHIWVFDMITIRVEIISTNGIFIFLHFFL